MKKIKSILALGLTLTSTYAFALAGNGDIGSGENPELRISCTLHRRYLNANGHVMQENITPSSAPSKVVKIEKEFIGISSPTAVRFNVQTPDGEIIVTGTASAVLFGSNYHVNVTVGTELVDKQIFLPVVMNNESNQEQKFFNINQKDVSVTSQQSFGVGKSAQGSMVNNYISTCELTRK